MKKSKYIDLKTRQGRQQFYQSPEWRAIRYIVLSQQPWCVHCLKEGVKVLATEVDHIVDIVDNPLLFMDIDNLQGLCKPCHAKKTMISNLGIVHPVYTVVNKKWK